MDGLPKNIAEIPEPDEAEVLETIKDITDLRAKVLRHYDKFLCEVTSKRIKLEDSRRYQLFLLGPMLSLTSQAALVVQRQPAPIV